MAERVHPPGGYDLVLANIRAETLIPRARSLRECMAPGAELVLSGVLADELEAVELAFREASFIPAGVSWPRRLNEWVALDLRRSPP